MWKWLISSNQYGRQLPSWILQIYSYVHDAIDICCLNLFFEVWMCWFYAWKRMKVYVINFYHHYSLSALSLAAGRILFRHKVLMQISFFFYTFRRPAVFCWKTIMNVEDFCSTHSNYKLTTELFKYRTFQKLSKDFSFQRNQCKMKIIYSNALDSWCIIFQNRFHLFIMHASFFHFLLCLFAKIAFFAVQITKGKLELNRKIENMQRSMAFCILRNQKKKFPELE